MNEELQTVNAELHGKVEELSFAHDDMQQAWQLVRDVFGENADPMAVLDARGKLIIFNAAFARVMKVDEQMARGTDVFDIRNGLLGNTDLQSKLKAVTKKRRISRSRPAGSPGPPGPRNILSTAGSSRWRMTSPTVFYCISSRC